MKDKVEAVKNLRGTEVSMDRFLFSCLEQEKLIISQTPSLEPEFETFPFNEEVDEGASIDDVIAKVGVLFDWYKDRYPVLTSKALFDFEKLNDVIVPTVLLGLDFKKLLSFSQAVAIAAYDKQSPELGPLWKETESQAQGKFENNSTVILRYLHWCFAPDKLEFFEASAPMLDTRRHRGGRSRDRDSRKFGGGSRDRGRPSQSRRGGHDRRPQRGHDHNREQQNREMEKEVTDEVRAAVEKLSQDQDTREVTLKAVNSFYRRLQHKLVSDHNMFSFSVGEGQERAVKVVRTKAEIPES